MKRVGLLTCRDLPEPDPDQTLLLKALRDGGFGAEMIAWDDPSSDPASFDVCVFRSTWNYHLKPDEFLDWLDGAESSTLLMNSPIIVRENFHKSYLLDLERKGVPVIPTHFLDKGATPDLSSIMREKGWDDVVVKPSVSAASYRTARFTSKEVEDGGKFLSELCRDRDAMVQQYMPSVETTGERAVIWIGGEITHAIRKSPRFHDGAERVSAAVPVSSAERSAALAALDAVTATGSRGWCGTGNLGRPHTKDDLLYARIDLIEDAQGRVLLSELELIEPSLFLLQNPAAAGKLCRAIGALL
jgi:hypothetical protein